MKAADIADAERVRPFHDLRHASLTNGAAAGEAPIALMARAGHRSMRTTQTYLHLAASSSARRPRRSSGDCLERLARPLAKRSSSQSADVLTAASPSSGEDVHQEGGNSDYGYHDGDDGDGGGGENHEPILPRETVGKRDRLAERLALAAGLLHEGERDAEREDRGGDREPDGGPELELASLRARLPPLS
jgi:hypothetical protein